MIKKIIIKFLNLIITFVFIIFVLEISETNEKDNNINKITKVNQVTETSLNINIPDKRLKLAELQQINPDIKAWINIPGTSIDWPVMRWVEFQNEKRSFYDRKDEYKNYAFEGSIYSGEGVVFSPFKNLSNNLIIHGHNLDDNPNGKRFAQLVKFQDIEFAKNTPYIFITTEDSQLVYQIFAVFFTDINFECYWVGLDEKRQAKMIDEARSRSEYNYDVSVSGKDKIITLSTCTYRYGKYQSFGQKNTRFVIQGKLLNKNDQLFSSASLIKNPTPKQPEIFKN